MIHRLQMGLFTFCFLVLGTVSIQAHQLKKVIIVNLVGAGGYTEAYQHSARA